MNGSNIPNEHSYVWERGRIERKTSFGNTGCRMLTILSSLQRFPWESMTPFGFDVVPDV